jgi:hypothetical protein
VTFESVAAVIHGESESIGLSGVGESKRPELDWQKLGVRLLKAEHVGIPASDEVGELMTRRVFAEVVADDSDVDTLRGGTSPTPE